MGFLLGYGINYLVGVVKKGLKELDEDGRKD